MQSGLPIGRMVPRQPPSTQTRRAGTLRCQDPACAYPGGAPLRRGKGPYARKCDACEERATTRRLDQLAKRPVVTTEDPDEWFDWAQEDQITRRRRAIGSGRKRTAGEVEPCECGGQKRKGVRRCRECERASRRKPGSRYGEICLCGGAKSSGSVMCHKCRYGRAAA